MRESPLILVVVIITIFASACTRDRTLESCVACGKDVSKQATTCHTAVSRTPVKH